MAPVELGKAAPAELLIAAERMQAMANRHPALLWISDETGLCIEFNDAWLKFRGRSLEQEFGDGWLSGVHPEDAEACMSTYLAHFAARTPFEMVYRLARHDGEYRQILDAGAPWYHSDGSFAGFVGSCMDITDHVRVRRELRQSTELFRDALEALADGIIVADASGRVLSLNSSAKRMLGTAADELLGQPMAVLGERLPTIDPSGAPVGAADQPSEVSLRTGEPAAPKVLGWSLDGQSIRWHELTSRPLRDPSDGRLFAVVTAITDVTEHRALLERVRMEARLDMVTGLVNRRGLAERVTEILGRTPRAGSEIGLVYCDVDSLKAVNDELGHDAGDALLRAVGDRIAKTVRSSDVVGRVGGDEMIVVLDRVDGWQGAVSAAEKIRAAVRQPLMVAGQVLHPTLSIGVALLDHAGDLERAITRADAAMYQAKRAGRDQVVAALYEDLAMSQVAGTRFSDPQRVSQP